MPRRARLEVPGVPMHITQRGVNRCAIFLDVDDRRHYLQLLRRSTEHHEVAVHAYALMGNHVHLLTSSDKAGSVSSAMRWLNQCYTQAFNRRHGRTGTLWDGRFKSCLVERENYLLTVYRYVDLNPVRAAIVEAPDLYPWSSARGNLGLGVDPVITPHEVFLEFTGDPNARSGAYSDWLEQGICDRELTAIRAYVHQEKAFGSKRFRTMIERTLNRDASWRPCGRPISQSAVGAGS